MAGEAEDGTGGDEGSDGGDGTVMSDGWDKEKPAQKYDQGKVRMGLIPPEVLELLGDVYSQGAGKYGDFNWLKGLKYSRIYDAMLRHLCAWLKGERWDGDSGCHHLAAVMWGCGTLMMYEKLLGVDLDDRPCMFYRRMRDAGAGDSK